MHLLFKLKLISELIKKKYTSINFLNNNILLQEFLTLLHQSSAPQKFGWFFNVY